MAARKPKLKARRRSVPPPLPAYATPFGEALPLADLRREEDERTMEGALGHFDLDFDRGVFDAYTADDTSGTAVALVGGLAAVGALAWWLWPSSAPARAA